MTAEILERARAVAVLVGRRFLNDARAELLGTRAP
jgi:hypothetical protein